MGPFVDKMKGVFSLFGAHLSTPLLAGFGKRQGHRDPPLAKIGVVSGKRMKEIRGHLIRWPLKGAADTVGVSCTSNIGRYTR